MVRVGALSEARFAVLRDPAAIEWLEGFVRARYGVESEQDVTLSFPSSGARTPVAIAAFDSRRTVVKLFKTSYRFATAAFVLRYLSARRLPVPTLEGWSLRSRLAPPRNWVTLEEWVPGRPLDALAAEDRPGAVERVAASLAALHSTRRRHHGRPGLPRRGSYVSFYLPRTLRRLEKLETFAPAGRIAELRAALTRSGDRIADRPHYELLHGHVNSGNVLVEDHSAVFIDVADAHYGDAARDLVRALHRLCASDAERESFLGSYFANSDGRAREDFEKSEPFYTCDFKIMETRRRAARESTSSSEVVRCIDDCLAVLGA